ncbi:uncharacterized protein E0L32_007649 [Thyridium curvatum]|uniref:protein-tyrosine-phosphatase n=1 Tax=Thyridium curvatum TaxID=1093900 RepID=A0A507B503_9PEZI|nr:uncharacterized protein E0L32_007649 [Thyridium curvatum]TPX11670.1 hypothetical protein E0L32_007649 [Thyridium curvatum]
MKTSRPPAVSSHSSHSHHHGHHGHSHTGSQSYRASKSSTPMASPRMPHSVGQPYPPKVSPSVSAGVARVAQQASQDARTPSPNYFGLAVEASVDPRDSAAVPNGNWSPPSSSVRSFQAAIPQQLPLDANPEFEAFKRQADANRGKTGFLLGSSYLAGNMPHTPQPATPGGGFVLKPPRALKMPAQGGETVVDSPAPKALSLAAIKSKGVENKDVASNRMEVDGDTNSLHDSAYVSSDSKRNSEASLNPPSFFNMPRYDSPAQFETTSDTRTQPSRVEDRHPRLSVVQGKSDPPSPELIRTHRADTVPAKLEAGGPQMLSPLQLRNILDSPSKDSLLLLDLRVATHYSAARIRGALNLCIPTTLLKRATFNLQKLQQTFADDQAQERFASWQDMQYLVVYDSSSSDKRDAVAPMNMLKKFTGEGYEGHACILRGGFNSFAAAYPDFIDQSSTSSGPTSPLLSLTSDGKRRPNIAPVIGGVALPQASNNPNPFFSNIRQNMDLADGVGQMDVSVPSQIDPAGMPRWLRDAAETADHGKKVSDNFLHIELNEQSRMKNAYSAFHVGPGSVGGRQSSGKVQLSGIEKGVKNRYKDILPFEHARVRLQGRTAGDCDYVNASHVKASRSNKRYIASQGPLPATFEDFWSVIWDEDVRVIVMLTAESEGGQLKCHPYWTSREYGAIKLRLLSEKKVSLDIDKHRSNSTIPSVSSVSNNASTTPLGSTPSVAAELGRRRANTIVSGTPTPAAQAGSSGSASSQSETPFVIIRKFALSHDAHPFAPIREITHLHYPSWPDFGAPAQPSHLLALVELANVMQRAALPIDVPSALASASSERVSTLTPRSTSSSLSSASSTRSKTDAIPVTWHDEPEADAQARPMLVHCSAGCGRTGTFCTVDSVIDMLKRQRLQAVKRANETIAARESKIRRTQAMQQVTDGDGDVPMDESVSMMTAQAQARDDDEMVSPRTTDKSFFPPLENSGERPPMSNHSSDETVSAERDSSSYIDTRWLEDDSVDLIASTVEDFRTQRLSMVQSLRQFVLCYETVIEWIARLQDRGGNGGGPGPRGRMRSGSLQVGQRPN